jgi:hypothetical protein
VLCSELAVSLETSLEAVLLISDEDSEDATDPEEVSIEDAEDSDDSDDPEEVSDEREDSEDTVAPVSVPSPSAYGFVNAFSTLAASSVTVGS